ncbi:zinc/iron transporter protein [Sodiomyces alkalinus F11]|uniref:Zinc/iron transporter protein n=1 Tax=Sodiomyces alkalinus (strain CBS 110278 / VKM F-3762 / F11) TaxID=1314773 RepID=A0A3N2PU82_SODAK|nr:zinc/iron transporter protein [Sodiomyces alkalinus F11]ROT38060.1 zinc/iron transporter protein [Sodiomyces alkalinus F11]
MARSAFILAVAATSGLLNTASAHVVARQTSVPEVDAISDCSVSQSTQYCQADGTEFRIVATPTEGALPSSYTGCHPHGSDLYCFHDDGEVEVALAGAAVTPAPTATNDAHDHDDEHDSGEVTAVSDCRLDGQDVYCMWGSTEYSMDVTATATQDIAPEYTNCHPHDADLYCVGPDGDDILAVSAEAEEAPDEQHCHFHAGVEHCVGPGEGENQGTRSCERVDRQYNIPLRVGLLFVVLVTSGLGVFGPIFLMKLLPPKAHVVLIIIKQFGTGVIISTAFIHLYTHAQLMFSNPCLEGVEFEGTTAAIVMGGLFLSFLVEFIGQRIVRHKMSHRPFQSAWFRPETVSILVMEAGIIFHSVLIGITLVVAGDSFFLTLFIVIVFHQFFEGLALGSRIAALGTQPAVQQVAQRIGGHGHMHVSGPMSSKTASGAEPTAEASPEGSVDSSDVNGKVQQFTLVKKCVLAGAFALITPVGMAIGIGVLDHFNGNDPSTVLAIGILDAVSAGILVWVGVVEMWAEDWMFGSSELMNANWVVTTLAMFGMMAGMALMGLLGRWA